MQRLTPALLISLLCNAGAFAIENPVKSSAEIPRNALFDQLIGTWDVRYEYSDKKETQRAIKARCTTPGSSAAKLFKRSGVRTRTVRTYGPSVPRLIFTTSSISVGRQFGYIRRKA